MKRLMHVLDGIPMADFFLKYLDPQSRFWLDDPSHARWANQMIELAGILEQAQVGVDLSTATQLGAITFRPWGEEAGGQVDVRADVDGGLYSVSYTLSSAEAPWPLAYVRGHCPFGDPAIIGMVRAALERGLGPHMLVNPTFYHLHHNTPWHADLRPPPQVDESAAATEFRERRLVPFAGEQADGLADYYQNPEIPEGTNPRFAAACEEVMPPFVAKLRKRNPRVPPCAKPAFNMLRWSMEPAATATVGIRPFVNDSWLMDYSYPAEHAPWPGATIHGKAVGWPELEAMLRIAFDRAFRPQPAGRD